MDRYICLCFSFLLLLCFDVYSQRVVNNRDTSINNIIILDDFESIKSNLSFKDSDFKKDPKNDLDYLIFSNSKNQYLKLYLYPGNGCCQYFQVGYVGTKNKHYNRTKLELKTESDIHLGMSISEFKNKKDTAVMLKSGNKYNVIYTYEYFSEDLDQIRFCSKWIFKNDRLVEFGFGNTAYYP